MPQHPLRPTRWLRRRAASALVAGAALGLLAPLLPLLPAAPAAAATATEPATVTADALPTVQVDGVVWAQVIVGDRVYVTGDFDFARPAGAAVGRNQTARANVLAYDLRTGDLVTGWNASLNAQGLAIAASPDGTRVYVGGDFTQVNGATRNRIVALDAATGSLVPGFAPGVNGRVRSIVAEGGVVYAGGNFFSTGGRARTRLAAFAAGNGALQAWAPAADNEVYAMVAPAGAGTMVVGGRFATLGGADAYGHGAVDLATGAPRPFASNQVVRNAGPDSAIWHLAADDAQVYGAGYTFGRGGNLENTFAADARTGALAWANGCRGDTYGVAPVGGVLYSTGHPHDCAMVGGLPQTQPWTYQRAMASTTTRGANNAVNTGGVYNGRPAPDLLHWLPTLSMGSFTRQYQAGWTIAANSEYVVVGGEFPRVNGTNQQGLVRFAVAGTAPRKQGPQGASEMRPTATAIAPGAVRVSVTSAWDRDDEHLTYELLRGTATTSPVVASTTSASTWWNRPVTAMADNAAPAGTTQSYRVRVTDDDGNTATGPVVSVAVTGGAVAASAYADAVRRDGATGTWRLGEPSGTTAFDSTGADDLVLDASATRGTAPRAGTGNDAATTFRGTATTPASTRVARPSPATFTTEAWIRTTTTRGGKIIGFGSSATGSSASHDRHVYMTNSGQLVFGVYPGAARTVTSPARYNDGAWHHVVASLGSAGMELSVDGKRVAADPATTSAVSYPAFLRVGGDTLGAWPNRPSSSSFAGAIDDVAVYPRALSAATVAEHFRIGTGGTPANRVPVASFTAAATGLSVAVDGSGSTDSDGAVASHSWAFGDGTTGRGATTTHSYAAAGTYTVTLTVTDDGGATASTTRDVVVTEPETEPEPEVPAGPAVLAADTFGRTVTGGLGSAETGGAWATTGAAANLSVTGGAAQVVLPPGRSTTGRLDAVQAAGADVRLSLSADSVTGGGAYVATTVRRTAEGEYRGWVRLLADGRVQTALVRTTGGATTYVAPVQVLAGLRYAPGTQLAVRAQAVGAGPTALRLKVWPAGTTEPAGWAREATDATAGLQQAGSVGFWAYGSGSSTTTTLRLDDLAVTAP